MNRTTRSGIARLANIVFGALIFALPGIAAAAAPAWSNITPATGTPPAKRYTHAAVYDAAGNNMIVYAGCANAPAGCPAGDVWVLSNANGSAGGGTTQWTTFTPNQDPTNGIPVARAQHAAVYDSGGNNLIVFGGKNGVSLSDVWVLSNANDSSGGGTPTWKKLNPIAANPSDGTPAARYDLTAVYDSAGNNLIVFGGITCPSGCTYYNDVWVLSNANGSGGASAWTKLSPTPDLTFGSPAKREKHTAVYDAAGNNLIVYGGCALSPAGCPASDVWVLSHANGSGGTSAWTKLNPTPDPTFGSPVARYQHTAVYDAAGNNLIVFGGYNGSNNLSDVWVLSHANNSGGTPTWSNITPAVSGPAARHAHTAVFDATGNNMIVFAGYVAGVVNDVWVLGNASPYTPPVNVAANIDIRPNTAINTISLTQGTDIPVAILSSATFDATTQVDRTSLYFGKTGGEGSFKSCNLRAADVNADGYKDLVCHFNGTLGGFALGDTVGKLKGMTTLGGTVTGSDSVVIIK